MTDPALVPFDRELQALPAPLRDAVRRAGEALRAQLSPRDAHARWRERLPAVLAGSEFVTRALTAQPSLLDELVASGDLLRAYAPTEPDARLAALLTGVADEVTLRRRLRQFRRRELVRIAFRDLAGFADLHEVMATMSALADACISQALVHLLGWAKQKFGTPIGAPIGTERTHESIFVVLGMGKLGGHELNFSSDVDLIFAYS